MDIINIGGDNLLQPFPQVMVIALMSGFEGKGFSFFCCRDSNAIALLLCFW